ncbi:cag pathogenicity island protein Cag25 [Pseudoalteromonas sp. 13-15]|uniref:cag pathogenicity island protein Cag25 n=1 Tax=Pseudoalteromonas TaxID=53246 RepID=UPI000731DEE4|nr:MULTISPECIES: cag pathogenicity island protein Cag25 [Pseudoalteromonas]AUL74787.1 cag pathogenicity island protein Cag25 [Pseudoalteromonas sp. 13-15]WFO19656.1 EF-hand domain-containing protein [Pseudoalteromonas sp. H100]SIO09156.1 EF hand [Pseudoalteromonas marina]
MRAKALVFSTLLTLGLVNTDAYAMDVEATFDALDKDNNGLLSEAEAQMDAVLKENFAQIDTDQSGQLSLNEFSKFIQ